MTPAGGASQRWTKRNKKRPEWETWDREFMQWFDVEAYLWRQAHYERMDTRRPSPPTRRHDGGTAVRDEEQQGGDMKTTTVRVEDRSRVDPAKGTTT